MQEVQRTETEPQYGDVIATYTRAQAIEDGVLVDVSETAREAGFVVPVAVTRAVWEDCCDWESEADQKKNGWQSTSGRLWDVVSLARWAIRRARRGEQHEALYYRISRVPRVGHGRKRIVILKLVSGAGDDGEHVITIMQPEED